MKIIVINRDGSRFNFSKFDVNILKRHHCIIVTRSSKYFIRQLIPILPNYNVINSKNENNYYSILFLILLLLFANSIEMLYTLKITILMTLLHRISLIGSLHLCVFVRRDVNSVEVEKYMTRPCLRWSLDTVFQYIFNMNGYFKITITHDNHQINLLTMVICEYSYKNSLSIIKKIKSSIISLNGIILLAGYIGCHDDVLKSTIGNKFTFSDNITEINRNLKSNVVGYKKKQNKLIILKYIILTNITNDIINIIHISNKDKKGI